MISHFVEPFLVPILLAVASTALLLVFADTVFLLANVAKLLHPVHMAKHTSVAGFGARFHRTEAKHPPAHSTMQAPLIHTCTD
jgi:hypothetical protein